jgi:hypothetical protein
VTALDFGADSKTEHTRDSDENGGSLSGWKGVTGWPSQDNVTAVRGREDQARVGWGEGVGTVVSRQVTNAMIESDERIDRQMQVK